MMESLAQQRWVRVQEIFYQLLDSPSGDRPALLETLCGSDTELRKEVQSLLTAHGDTAGFMTEPALGEAFTLPEPSHLLDEPPDLPIGRRVGAYRLVDIIASGGMGAVYRAVRVDGEYETEVAVKLIRHGIDSRFGLRRFRAERQLLAQLQHDNIARLLDGGATEQGLPYLVMEYIEGLPIDQYCDTHRLTIAERLRLFRTVCSAVHYAHQNLIVHCDLKPNNILVTPRGVPKLLDFGIAKMLQAEAPSGNQHPTTVPLTLMTPDYASPEQITGQPLTTASDVYSLGVILYELICGQRPIRLSTRVRHDLERQVCKQYPDKPSSVVGGPGDAAEAMARRRRCSAHRLRNQLAGYLDNIVLMALRKEPDRRYASAEQLSQDLWRHLNGLPVIARQDTLGYRCAKFIRRNRMAVATAAMVVVGVLAGILAITWAWRIARLEKEKNHAIAVFWDTTLSSVDKLGSQVTVREVLDRSAAGISSRLAGQPLVRAAVQQSIGNAYRSLAEYDLAEPHLQAAVAAYQQLRPGSEDLASSLRDLAALLEAKADYTAARRLFMQALATYQELHGESHMEVAYTLTQLAVLLHRMGQDQEAEPLYRRASALYRTLLGGRTDDITELDLANSYANLAMLLEMEGDWTAADQLYRQALAQARAAAGSNGQDHPQVAECLHGLAAFLHKKGEYLEAERLYSEALDIRRRRLGEDHTEVAETLHGLATVLYEEGNLDEALRRLDQALSIRHAKFRGAHPEIAATLMEIGRLLMEQGHALEAVNVLRESLLIRQTTLPADHWEVSMSEMILGACLTRLGRFTEAEDLLLNSHDKLRTDCGGGDDRTLQAYRYIVDLYRAWDKPGELEYWRAMLDDGQ